MSGRWMPKDRNSGQAPPPYVHDAAASCQYPWDLSPTGDGRPVNLCRPSKIALMHMHHAASSASLGGSVEEDGLGRVAWLEASRAGMVRSSKDWRRDNRRATAGLTESPEWHETGWASRRFGAVRGGALSASKRFAAEGHGSAYEASKEVQGQIYLGSDDFNLAILGRGAVGRQGKSSSAHPM